MELKPYRSEPTAARQDANSRDEKVVALFEPDILLPAQFLANHRRKTFLQPEKTLMLAVLDDAVRCFKDHADAQGGRRKKWFDDATEWLTAQDDDGVFSFENICDVLGMNAAYLRRGLLDWRTNKVSNDGGRLARYDRRNRLRAATSRLD